MEQPDQNNSTMMQQPEPPTPAELEMREKEHQIMERKKRFDRFFGLIKFILLVIFLAFVGYYVYLRYNPGYVPPYTTDQNPTPTPEPSMVVSKTSLYKSDNLKLSVEYPKEAQLFETDADVKDSITKKIEVISDKGNTDLSKVNEANLKDGYIFRVSTFTTASRSFDEIAQVKMESLKAKCPPTTVFSEISKGLLDTIDARSFSITNCNAADYVITYVPRFNMYYEFAQITRGDLGYKESYKATTDEIINAVRFYPDLSGLPPFSDYVKFEDKLAGISFEQPRWDNSCCEISGPESKTARMIVTLGNKETMKDRTNFDGVGVFKDSVEMISNFDAYMEGQKQLLVDDYTVVRGAKPTAAQEISLTVDGHKAVMLKGYSWKDIDLLYIDNTADLYTGEKPVIVITSKNISGKDFEEKFDHLVKSFKFLPRQN